jgi:hypothetical protein
MTKAELQSAVAAAAQTDKKTAGVFLDTLSAIALQGHQKERRIRRAWIWEARKTEEESSHRDQSKDATEDQNSRQNRD